LVSQISPDKSLTGAQALTYNRLSDRMNRLGTTMSGQWGGNVVSLGAALSDETGFQISSTFYSDIWESLYLRTGNFTDIIYYQDEKDWNDYKAVAYIMRSFYLQYIVDLYGDAPYTEMHLRNENFAAAYDDDFEIYKNLISDLDKAIALIANTTPESVKVGTDDAIFQGDMTKWAQFAQTVKLRLALRGSSSNVASESTYFTAILNSDFTGVAFLSEAVTINPGYSNDTDKQNYFYSKYGKGIDGSAADFATTPVASKFLVDFMLDNTDGVNDGVNDTRLQAIYAPATPIAYFGIEQNLPFQSVPSGQKLNLLTQDQGLLVSATQDGIIMTEAEVRLLQAEAMLNGHIAGGDSGAQAMLNTAITSSYSYLGVAGGAAAYIAQANTINGLGWTGSNTDKMEAIITQKWLANGGINGIESWIEFTRTGYPSVPVPADVAEPAHPKRLLYPQSEILANANNVPSQTKATAFASGPFWAN
ncbi:MAG: SusD/RagB family nutrient-binding outer membrane lipoprotein, partial [Flavobacteriaceae bacterium]|nr:SusD/RagB family nutrient-binding outer membrane lipoprotein [Flavobacteriaceae bacterium]